MKTIDSRRRAAHRDGAAARQHDEPGLWSQIAAAFEGRNAWTSWYTLGWTLAAYGLGIWAAVEFFQTPEPSERLAWGLLIVVCLHIILLSKLWFWSMMSRRVVLEEIWRLHSPPGGRPASVPRTVVNEHAAEAPAEPASREH